MKKSLILLALTSILQAAPPPDTCTQATWCANDIVQTVLPAGNKIYLGGKFSQVGTYMGCGIPVDVSTGAPASTFAKIPGTVYAVCADGSGGWFVGGSFGSVGGMSRRHIAHILQSGATDPSWNPGADSAVYVLCLNGTVLYAGGLFMTVGNEKRRRVAAIDVVTGTPTSWNPGATRKVTSFALSGTTLFVGGNFDSIGGQLRGGLAGVSTVTGDATSLNIHASYVVRALALSGTTLFVGGGFNSLGGESRRKLAAVDITTGDVLAWNPGLNQTISPDQRVNCFAVNGGTIYIGGLFDSVGSQSRRNIAAADAVTGAVLPFDPQADDEVISIAAGATTVYAGGLFLSVGRAERNRIAALDATTGTALSWNPNGADDVFAIALHGATVFIGGAFPFIGGQTRNRIAALSAITGQALPWDPNANGTVWTLAKSGNMIFAGGDFTTIGGSTKQRIAALDTGAGLCIGSWTANATGSVRSFAVHGGTLYTGGKFTAINNSTRNHLAGLQVSSGSVISWNPNASNTVYAIAASGSKVFVGGSFDSIAASPYQSFIAGFDIGTGGLLSWYPAPLDTVYALAAIGDIVYAGGEFSRIRATSRQYLGAIDTTAYPTKWYPKTNTGFVYSIALCGTTVYAGGYGGVSAIDSATGNALDWNPDAEKGGCFSLAPSGSTVYVGGDFWDAGPQGGHPYFAQYGVFYPWPDVASVTPSSAVNNAAIQITDVHGSYFISTSSVKFIKQGQPVLNATNVSVVSAAQITCSVDITNAAPGLWDIVVSNEEFKNDTLKQCFTVLSRSPNLIAPAHNAVNISLTPTLTWHKLTDDSSFTLQLSASPDFSSFIINDNLITDSSVTLPPALLANNSSYYWKVAARKKNGETTEFCASWKFTTISPPAKVPLLAPSAGAVIQVDNIMFIWNKASGSVDKYCFEVFSDSLLNGRVCIDSAITDTVYTKKGLQNHASYWWRIKAHNSTGWGVASDIGKFSLEIPAVSVLPATFSCLVKGVACKSGAFITFGLPVASNVSIELYNVQGKLLRSLLNAPRKPGYHRIPVDVAGFSRGYVIVSFKAGKYAVIQRWLSF